MMDSGVYEEVEADSTANVQALVVIVASAVAAGLGSGDSSTLVPKLKASAESALQAFKLNEIVKELSAIELALRTAGRFRGRRRQRLEDRGIGAAEVLVVAGAQMQHAAGLDGRSTSEQKAKYVRS
jgi:hypothetical protein